MSPTACRLRTITIVIVILLSLCAVGYAAWYTYNRHVIAREVVACAQKLSTPTTTTALDGSVVPVYIVDICAATVVPPPLLDLIRGRMTFTGVPKRMKVNTYTFTDALLGRYTLGPADVLPCNQSATTTDCALILALNTPSQPQPAASATTTSAIGNFTIEHPSDWYVTGYGWEQTMVPGAYHISIPASGPGGERHIFIFTEASMLSSLNPNAKSLDDYRSDYPIDATSSRQILVNGTPTTIVGRTEVRIHSSEDVTINGIQMLRQRYSVGEWSLDSNGNRYFDSSSEANVTNQLRYVFFDGKTFVVLTGWQVDSVIDSTIRTIRLRND